MASPRPLLESAGTVFLNFRDHRFAPPGAHGFRWVHVERFHVATERTTVPDTDLLRALVAHPCFRNDHAGGGADPEGVRHGPYWLARVTPQSYAPLQPSGAVRLLEEWARQYGALPASLAEEWEREVLDTVRSAGSVHRLRDLGPAALHDWGGVHGDFHELVAVGPARRSLVLLVAADD